jgi:hypothetical protein
METLPVDAHGITDPVAASYTFSYLLLLLHCYTRVSYRALRSHMLFIRVTPTSRALYRVQSGLCAVSRQCTVTERQRVSGWALLSTCANSQARAGRSGEELTGPPVVY